MQCALSLLLLLSASSLRVCSAHGKLTKPTPRDGISVGRAGLDQNNPVSFEPGCAKENTCDAFVCREAAPNPNVPATSVAAGQSLQLGWSFTALHVGDCSVYISYDIEKPRSQQKYVKIANIPDCKKYTTWNIEIPASLPAGKAILRWDWVALHVWPKTENFVQCADLDIKSSSTMQPSEMASFSITNPPIYPDDGNDGVGFRNAFGTGAQDMTGTSCIDDSINECRLTARGTLRNTDSRRGSGASRPVPGPSPVPPSQAKPQPQPQPVPEPLPQPTFAPQPAAGACVSNDPVIDYSVACKALEATCELYSFCKRVPVPPPKPQPQPQPASSPQPKPGPAGSSPTPEAEAEEEEEEEEEAEAETPEAESEKEEEEKEEEEVEAEKPEAAAEGEETVAEEEEEEEEAEAETPEAEAENEEEEEAEAEKPEAESEAGAEEEEAEGEAEEETEEHASPSPPRTTSKPVTDCAALWEQCGGEGWAGHTCCAVGSSCRAHNQWYHQCWPGGSLVSLAARSEESDSASDARKLRGRRAHRHYSMMLVEVARHSTIKGEVSDDDADGAIAFDMPPPRAARDAEL